MELKKPTPKKKPPPKKQLTLPLKTEKEITGIFNGQFVTIADVESMNYLHETGNFGKGSLSRGKPNYHDKKDDIPEIILQHQFEDQSKWNTGASFFQEIGKHSRTWKDFDLSFQSINNLLQSSFADSDKESWKSWKEEHQLEFHESIRKNELAKKDSTLLEFEKDESSYEDEDFRQVVNEILESRLLKKPQKMSHETNEVVVLSTCFDAGNTNITPASVNSRLENLCVFPEENLNLSLEESFFLKSQLGCLNIIDLSSSQLGTSELWEKFSAVDENFKDRYVSYHYYRAKGWVVKSGLKFGGDFLLYKDGPAHYHSSYLTKVLDRRKKLTWREFVMMNRLVETFNKDLILCNVLPMKTSEEQESFPEEFTKNSIQEVLVRRWFPSKERLSKANG